MKLRFVLITFLCLMIVLTAVSCDTSNKVPDPSTDTDPAPLATTIPETEAFEPLDWNVTTDHYSIQEIDGRCYMTFEEEYQITEEDSLACQLGEIYFDSMEDMIRAFMNNGLTPEQELVIQASFPKTEKGIGLWEKDQLYSAVVPAGANATSLALHGETYDYVLKGDLFKSGWIACLADWTYYKDHMYDWSDGATVTRREEATFDGVSCRIVEYYNTAETYRDIFIETEKDGKKVDMVIRYLLEDKRKNPEPVSDTAPWNIQMFCEDNGVYYYTYMKEFTETPTYEWLSSFGLTPYVSTADQAAPAN